jgi:hypothetical protein
LGLAFQLLLAERRQGNAEKADAFGDGEQWLDQRVAKLLDVGSRRKERLTGPASLAASGSPARHAWKSVIDPMSAFRSKYEAARSQSSEALSGDIL